ncbi:MAG TPA: hypothetical protein VM677_18705 [Actinokineospora sp.]|nr:hypothetical protein [Actinokineospora sp.]
MGVRIDVRPAPVPRTRAARAAVAAAAATRTLHALVWAVVLFGGDLLLALAVNQAHGDAAGTGLFAGLAAAIGAGLSAWTLRRRPHTTTTVQEFPNA